MNTRDKKYMDLAFNLALTSEKIAGARLGAILVSGNKVVSMGCNQRKTHPLQKRWGKNPESIFLHAEVSAIVNFLRFNKEEELHNTTLYISRVMGNGVATGLAKPCPGCEAAINNYGIKKVVYTDGL